MARTEMKLRFNVKLAALLLGTAAALAGSVVLLHRQQVKRNTEALRQLAEFAESNQELERAAKYYRLYLAQEPASTDALTRLTLIRIKLATNPWARFTAMIGLEQVLRRQPDQHDIRRQLADYLLDGEIGRYNDAKEHLVFLLQTFPNEAGLHCKLGHCEAEMGSYAAAQVSYTAAIKLAPGLLEAYRELADLQRRQLHKPAAAAQTLELLVAENPRQPRAYLYRARQLRHNAHAERDRQSALARADADLKEADRLASVKADRIEILLESVELAVSRAQIDRARAFIERGLEIDTRDMRFFFLGARLEVDVGRSREAMAFLHRALAVEPDNVAILWELSQLLIDAQEWNEAADVETKMRKLGLPAPGFEFLRGRALVSKGQWLQAARLLETLRPELKPWPDTVLRTDLLLAVCHARLGDRAQQEVVLRRALKMDSQSLIALMGLGDVLLAKGDVVWAFDAYRSAAPRSSKARFRAVQAFIQHNLKKPAAERVWDEAERLLAPSVDAALDAVDLALLRADVLLGQNDPHRAADVLAEAIRANPKQPLPWRAQAALLQRQEKWSEALTLLDDAEKNTGDCLDLNLARVRFWSERGGSEASTALFALSQKAADKYAGADWQRWTRGLADAWLSLGLKQEAAQLYALLAQRDRTDLNLRFVLFDVADDAHPAEELMADIRRIEGDNGAMGQFIKACTLLRQARAHGNTPPGEVGKLLSPMAAHAPSWPRFVRADAEWDEMCGRREDAIRKYLKAIEAGERNAAVLQRTAALLKERDRHDEALRVLQAAPRSLLSGLE